MSNVVELLIADIRAYSENQIKEMMTLLDPERQHKAAAYRYQADRVRTVVGECLVRERFAKELGCSPGEVEISRGTYGKPYVPGAKMKFNISHSGNYVAAGFSGEEIGVDIEAEVSQETAEDIAKMVCSEDELRRLSIAQDRSDAFTRLWTLKESFLKAVGYGFSYNDKYPSFYMEGGLLFSDVENAGFIMKRLKNGVFEEHLESGNCGYCQDISTRLPEDNMEPDYREYYLSVCILSPAFYDNPV